MEAWCLVLVSSICFAFVLAGLRAKLMRIAFTVHSPFLTGIFFFSLVPGCGMDIFLSDDCAEVIGRICYGSS